MSLVRGACRIGRPQASLRAFASKPPAVPEQSYPLVYGTVDEGTVMSPYKGGPVYCWLRSTYIWLRRRPGRHWIRWLDRNWDFQKMTMFGVPELHIDPTKNRWRYMIDTSYYGGFMEKAHEDWSRYAMMYPALGFFTFVVYARMKENDKDNFLAKWRVLKEE